MRHDSGAFGHVGTHAAQMIEVCVSVDQFADRLTRNQALRLGNDCRRSLIVLPTLDDGDVILESTATAA